MFLKDGMLLQDSSTIAYSGASPAGLAEVRARVHTKQTIIGAGGMKGPHAIYQGT